MAEEEDAAREAMDKLRDSLIAERRSTTPAGKVKPARRLIADVLLRHPAGVELGRKLAVCGRRNPQNDSRVFCQSPACPVCMFRKSNRLFSDLWLELGPVPSTRLRWVTVLLFADPDLQAGAVEMKRQHRRLQHVFKKFASETGRNVRAWGCREVERENAWLFHVHMLVDTDGADADALADRIRETFGHGDRQVQVKPLDSHKSHNANILGLARYMTKAKYHSVVNRRNVWLPDADIVDLAIWRAYRVPLAWHRFTLNVRISR